MKRFLLGDGWAVADIAKALLIDLDTVPTYFKRYKKGGLEALFHLQEHLHLTAESAARWVKEHWDVSYASSGMAALLRRLGYVYKKRD